MRKIWGFKRQKNRYRFVITDYFIIICPPEILPKSLTIFMNFGLKKYKPPKFIITAKIKDNIFCPIKQKVKTFHNCLPFRGLNI